MKRLIIKRLGILLTGAALLCGVSGCENEIPFVVEDDRELLVLNADLRTDVTTHVVYVGVSRVVEVDRAEGARVLCYVNGKLAAEGVQAKEERVNGDGYYESKPTEETLRMLEEAGLDRYVLYGPSTVFLMEVQFRPGDQVKIEAVRGNDHAYAEVVVPEAPKVLSVTPEKIYVRQYEDIYPCISFAVRLEDRPGTDDYFRIGMGSDVRQTFHFRDEAGVTLRPDTTLFYGRDFRPEIGRDPILNDGYTFENFENDFFADFNATNTARIFSDRLFSGSECTVKPFADSSEFTPRFYNWTAYAPDGEMCSSSGFEADPTAVVKVMAISRMHYAYYKALNNGEVFGFDTNPIVEPVALPSNVEGGLGFVGIASTASVRVEMPRVTEKDIHWTPMY